MIKRLIFDVDNTLIMWKKEYDKAILEALDKLNYPHNIEICEKINELDEKYEKNRKYFSRKDMLDFFNSHLEKKLPDEFVNMWIKCLSECVPKRLDDEVYETLEYLYQKYELVILTNWFEENQVERLKKVNILKYFKKIYTAENYAKPYKESYLQAAENVNINECAIIGDSLEIDIIPAKKAGIGALVWLDNFNEENKKELKEIKIIKKLSDLKQIF